MRIIAVRYYQNDEHVPYILIGEVLEGDSGTEIRVYYGGYNHLTGSTYSVSWLSSDGSSTNQEYTVLVDDPHCKSLKHFVSIYPHLFI